MHSKWPPYAFATVDTPLLWEQQPLMVKRANCLQIMHMHSAILIQIDFMIL